MIEYTKSIQDSGMEIVVQGVKIERLERPADGPISVMTPLRFPGKLITHDL